ncbi:MAG: SulP family inorganic anion transporter [Xanthobacteraceae bacterium]|jgi:sulfate permease, SulP family
MEESAQHKDRSARFSYLPPVRWLATYQKEWLPHDLIAGVTLAAYAIPVSLAYAALAELPPQVGIYGYLLGGIGYALFGSSRQLAVGPTSAISLMIAATVVTMAGGDAQRYIAIASLAAFTVALLCAISWLLRLSMLVRLISDSILLGFKAGAGLTIIMTQLPSLFGIPGGGHNFFERILLFAEHLGQTQPLVLAIGVLAIAALLLGDRFMPGRPIALVVVAVAIIIASVFGLSALGVAVTGKIPPGLPALSGPDLRLRDVEGIFPLAAGCLLLAYIEGVSAARAFAAKHGYELDPRQELLGLGAANLAAALGQGYPVAGGLSQSAVNDKAGARTPLSLIFASITLALCLMFLTGFLENLPKAVLAAVVFTAVIGLVDVRSLYRTWRISKMDFYAAAVALCAVLLLGIMQGMLLAAGISLLMLVARASQPHVAFLGRVPGTHSYSDLDRHPENENLPHVLAFRPEASLLYVNADPVLHLVLDRVRQLGFRNIRAVVCDLSASPYVDLAGSRMLHQLHGELAPYNIVLRIVGARGRVRDLLRADGLGEKVGGLARVITLDSLLSSLTAAEGDAR